MPRGIPNAPTAREVHTENMPIRGYQVLDMTSGQAIRPLAIEPVDPEVLKADHAEKLVFNEDPLEIRLEPGRERNAPKVVDVAVNGERRWLPVGVPIRIQRKFVEVLARSQPFAVETRVGRADEEHPANDVLRNPFRQHPFTVLFDPNPRGVAWLNKISYEG